MNHLVIGSSVPFILGLTVYVLRRFRATVAMLLVVPMGMGAGMVWAVIPDIPRLLGDSEFYHSLARNHVCDIFLWHYTLDGTETYTPWFAVVFVVMAASLLFAAWRELRIAELSRAGAC
ncbi:MAG: hypothetical protein R6V03_01485 [Kiritimatiellia bacterium]